jgi:uncharacterized membrane protein YfbV (UPF0208 family)
VSEPVLESLDEIPKTRRVFNKTIIVLSVMLTVAVALLVWQIVTNEKNK